MSTPPDRLGRLRRAVGAARSETVAPTDQEPDRLTKLSRAVSAEAVARGEYDARTAAQVPGPQPAVPDLAGYREAQARRAQAQVAQPQQSDVSAVAGHAAPTLPRRPTQLVATEPERPQPRRAPPTKGQQLIAKFTHGTIPGGFVRGVGETVDALMALGLDAVGAAKVASAIRSRGENIEDVGARTTINPISRGSSDIGKTVGEYTTLGEVPGVGEALKAAPLVRPAASLVERSLARAALEAAQFGGAETGLGLLHGESPGEAAARGRGGAAMGAGFGFGLPMAGAALHGAGEILSRAMQLGERAPVNMAAELDAIAGEAARLSAQKTRTPEQLMRLRTLGSRLQQIESTLPPPPPVEASAAPKLEVPEQLPTDIVERERRRHTVQVPTERRGQAAGGRLAEPQPTTLPVGESVGKTAGQAEPAPPTPAAVSAAPEVASTPPSEPATAPRSQKFKKLDDPALEQRYYAILDRIQQKSSEAGEGVNVWVRKDERSSGAGTSGSRGFGGHSRETGVLSGTAVTGKAGRAMGRAKDDARIMRELEDEFTARGINRDGVIDRYGAYWDARMEREGIQGLEEKSAKAVKFNPDELGRARAAALRSLAGAGVGGTAGATQGDTPEERRRNALLGAAAGALVFGGVPAVLDRSGKIKAFHGSPHNFEKFDMSKVGTGEGAQSYGHGLYFAENQDVARGYKERLSQAGGPIFPSIGVADSYAIPDWVRRNIADAYSSGGNEAATRQVDHAIAEFKGRLAEERIQRDAPTNHQPWISDDRISGHNKLLDRLEGLKESGDFRHEGGAVYGVEINADADEMLNWDKPISAQSPKVRAALERMDEPMIRRWKESGAWPDHVSGQNLYDALAGQRSNRAAADASRRLREAGVKGVQYLDQLSRQTYQTWRIIPAKESVSGKWTVGPGSPSAPRSAQHYFDTEAEARAFYDSKATGETHNYVVFDDALLNITEKGAASRAAVRGVAGAGVGAATGAATDKDNRLRGAALGAAAGAAIALGAGSEPVRAFVKRNFTSLGDLPAAAFAEKIARDGQVSEMISQTRYTMRDFRRAARQTYKASGPSTAELELLDRALKSEAPMTSIPAPMQPVVAQMRREIDALSQRMIDVGAVEGELVGKVTDNFGVYATRSYRVFDDPKWAKKVDPAVRNRAKAWLRGEYPNAAPEEIDGLMESLLYKLDDGPVAMLQKGRTLGSKDLSILQRRKEIAPELRALWGEYHDPRVNYARSVTKMAHLIGDHQFLTEVRAQGLGQFFHESPIVRDGVAYKAQFAAEGSKVLAPLNGLYTTPEIAKAFKEAVEPQALPSWLKWYMRANAGVKYAKTVGSLMTHVRNTVGNIGFAVANGHWRLAAAPKAVRAVLADIGVADTGKWRDYYRKLQKLGVVADNANAGELQAVLRDAGARSLEDPEAWWPARTARKGLDAITTAYRAEDDVWKVFAFENERARYAKALPKASADEIAERAAEIVRNTYPTYSMVPRGIQALRRFPIVGAFVSFPAEVFRTLSHTIRLTGRELADPATRGIGAQRLAGLMAALTAVPAASAATRMMNGVNRDEDEAVRQFLPPWQENSDLVHLNRSADGQRRFVDVSYSDPYNYIRKPLMAFMRGEDWQQGLAHATAEAGRPFLGEEILAGKLLDISRNQTADGRRVWNPAADPDEQAQAILDHLWDGVQPGTIASAERIWKGVTGEQSVTGRSYDPKLEALAVMTGQRVQSLDPEQALSFRAREIAGKLGDAHQLLTSVSARRGTVSDEELRAAFASANAAQKRLTDQLTRQLAAAQRLGVDEKTAMRVVELAGVPQRMVRSLARGGRPYEPSTAFWNQLRQEARTDAAPRQRIDELRRRVKTLRQEARAAP